MNGISKLAREIDNSYCGLPQPPILLGVITGVYTMIDLSRLMKIEHHIDTIGVRRYSANEVPSIVELTSHPRATLAGRDIIIVEDVMDIGLSMQFIKKFLEIQSPPPDSIKILVLGWKKLMSQIDFEPDYVGFEIGPEWIIGEGMDSDQGFRNLKGIWQKVKE